MRAPEHVRDDEGLTLVELLISMVIVMVLVAVTITIVQTSSTSVATTSDLANINEDARHALNRMARDMRQAKELVSAVDPDGPAFSTTHVVAVRLRADYDGDGCLGSTSYTTPASTCNAYNAGNPEDITYCFEPPTYAGTVQTAPGQLYVIDNLSSPTPTPVTASSTSCSGGQPLLAGNVSAFKVEYRSNQYRYDLDPSDGVTTWTELDQGGLPSGNENNTLDVELSSIDSVVLNMTVSLNGHAQTYRTQVDLRNVS